jgi:hypothetical protein
MGFKFKTTKSVKNKKTIPLGWMKWEASRKAITQSGRTFILSAGVTKDLVYVTIDGHMVSKIRHLTRVMLKEVNAEGHTLTQLNDIVILRPGDKFNCREGRARAFNLICKTGFKIAWLTQQDIDDLKPAIYKRKRPDHSYWKGRKYEKPVEPIPGRTEQDHRPA